MREPVAEVLKLMREGVLVETLSQSLGKNSHRMVVIMSAGMIASASHSVED